MHGYASARQLALHQCQGFLQHLVDIQQNLFLLPFLRQRPDVADDFAGAAAIRNDADERGAHLFQVRLLPIQPAQRRFSAGHDGRQGLVDLVRDGCRQFAERRHPHGMSEGGLGGKQCLLRARACGDVRIRLERRDRPAVLVGLQ